MQKEFVLRIISVVLLIILSSSCKKETELIEKTIYSDNYTIVERKINESSDLSYLFFYDANNKLIKKNSIYKDKKNGKEISYYQNGRIEYICNFKNDKLNGTSYFYYNNPLNTIKKICFYENGKLIRNQQEFYTTGKIKNYFSLLPNQSIAFKMYLNEQGQLISEGRYKTMGVFFKTKKLKRVKYTSYFSIPSNVDIIYKYSVYKIDCNNVKWIQKKIDKSYFVLDTIVKDSGVYVLREYITITDKVSKIKKNETYNFKFEVK
ncbi:toxin-antitoxin system YwqK family antitoxin [Flavobacterium oreochromis]|uniref:toxin-antitoxin system YwqK family antitoxin n=1 Tax=Flavobacterium oreochromis TaxID=2906078 RepID=UPI00385EEF3D